jgi:catechol 2,3-dioxygenase-like lactoylglutathione lyase family enzyme
MSSPPLTTESTLVKGLNHTSYTVYDLDRILSFFTEGLGFPLLNKGPRDPVSIEKITGVQGADVIVAFVQAPGHRIELFHYLTPNDRRRHDIRPSDQGFSHLAFDVTDIDKVVEVGRRFGFQPVYEPLYVNKGPNTGQYAAYLREPDGLTVEVIGPRIK